MFGISFLIGAVAIIFAVSSIWRLRRQPPVPREMAEIADHIAVGANSYLLRQLKTISFVMPFLFVGLCLAFGWKIALTSILGVYSSLAASFIGMKATTFANSRVTRAATESSDKAFQLAVLGGSVMGLSVPGLSLIFLSILYLIFKDPEPIIGFGFGASLAALFAQIGGGIFTKSADIGADLVGKVERNLPEDDPRNPAVIADLVGDNVGDCAGRGADLFQTFSDDIITGTLVVVTMIGHYGPKALFFPILLQALGVISSLIGILVTRRWWPKLSVEGSFNLGLLVSAFLSCVSSFFLTRMILGDWHIWFGVFLGVLTTLVAATTTRYYAGMGGQPVKDIAEASKRGPALNLITALSSSLQSPIISIVMITVAVIAAYTVSGGLLLAVVAVNIGTDLLIGYIMTADAFGPVTDNAAGIAEMSGSKEETIHGLSSLDSVGNTMKAITKAYAMSSGTVTAFVIFATFSRLTGVDSLNIMSPQALGFIFLGVALPFLIASLVIGSTARGALLVVDEVRRQFKEIKGLLEGTAKPDYARCVDTSTKNALKEMVLPGVISIAVPAVLGFIFGSSLLAALLMGAVVASGLLGPFFNNMGTALDNAKKLIEDQEGMKGSFQHAAAVIGDTVGDPLKDVAGPSLLIFMKLIGMSALLVAPLLK